VGGAVLTADAPPVPVGFIGLGQMGKPMARRLTEWPGGLTVHDVVDATTRSFADRGVAVAKTPAEVAERAGVISVMVRDDAQVTDVLCGTDGILSSARPGTVVAIHSTVEATTPPRLAAIADEHGVHVVDAPVSGGPAGSANGTLAVMVGGAPEAVERVRAPFGCFASLVTHVGPVGAGTQAKLARNLITFVTHAAVGEALRLAEAAGLDLQLLGEVVRHSDRVIGGPGVVILRPTAAPIDEGDPLYPIFRNTRTLGERDLELALGLGEQLGVDLPITALALDTLGAALGVPHDPKEARDG
jgi:3-hydroxyisobutyrate dehydrogenase